MKMALVLLALVTLPTSAQTSATPNQADSFANAVKQASLPLTITNDGLLAGPGGKFMSGAIASAQFVLLGESHLSRETPLVAAAICRDMHPDSYAVEAGPYAAAFVNGLLHDPNRKAAMRQRQRLYPANMAFLNIEQENDLAASCATSSHNQHFELWGLDQEFLGAGTLLLKQMIAEPNGPATQRALQATLTSDNRAETEARSSGDFTKLFLPNATDQEIGVLQTAIDGDGTPATKAILRELVDSRRIYRLNMAGSPESNRIRGNLLKQHFLLRYQALQQTTPRPRILLKFGDSHMGKGFNDLHQLDLGDFIAQQASVQESNSLHILVLAAEGSLSIIKSYGQPLAQDSFDLRNSPDYKWLTPVLISLPKTVGPTAGSELQGVAVDLRSLRFSKIDLTPEWERVIYSYDVLIMLQSFSPANLLQ